MLQKGEIGIKVNLEGHYNLSNLCKFLSLLASLIFIVSCGGGSGSSNGYNSQPTSFPSSSSASSIAAPVSYKASGPCAEGSVYTLTITDGVQIDSGHLEKMICNFFTTYPKIVTLVNPNASKNVEFVFDPASSYIAAAYGTRIVYLPSYLYSAPDDTDVVVHETTHAAQAELVARLPGWIIEGTADFVRDLYGVDSKNIWSIPSRYVDRGGSYLDGYGNAAAFFKWIDAIYRQGELPVAVAISRTMLATPDMLYSDNIWEALTGKKLDLLWNEYINFPVAKAFTTGVSVYNGENFTGYNIKLERGNYDLYDLLSLGVTDNQIASIKVPEGYKVKAYVDVNFAGEQKEFTTNTPVLDATMALKISSIVVE